MALWSCAGDFAAAALGSGVLASLVRSSTLMFIKSFARAATCSGGVSLCNAFTLVAASAWEGACPAGSGVPAAA